MRRRRSRLPLIALAGTLLVLVAALGMAAAGIRPESALLSLLPSAASSASPQAAVPSADAPTAVAVNSAEPSPSSSPSPLSSPSPGVSAAVSPSATAGTSAGPSAAAPSVAAASASAVTVTTARAVYNGSRKDKVVALTFDDGYSPTALRQILAILKREHVTATFFPYGWAVHQDVAGWHAVVAAGYPIGNHTLTHAILTSLTPDQVTEQLVRGRRTIDLYSGGTTVNYMRPPGGAFNAPTSRAIAKAGYPIIVMWDVDTFDWQGPSVATITARAIKGTNGSIVLMHSGPANTPKALPAIIANYRARGFTFVTIPQLLAGGR